LHGSLGRNQTYQAQITGEGGRLNLSWVVAGEDPQRLEILRKYLENKGVDLNERDRMIDCLLDWIDPDDLVRLNGAEASDSYKPANTFLSRMDDLKKVKGWEQFTTRPDWDAILLSTAPGRSIPCGHRVTSCFRYPHVEGLVDRFLQLRRGPDQIDGTADDLQFKSLDELRLALGFSVEQFKQLATLVGFNDQVLRVVSVGKSARRRELCR